MKFSVHNAPYKLNFMWIRTFYGSGMGYDWERKSPERFLGGGGGFIATTVEEAVRLIPELFESFEKDAIVEVSNQYYFMSQAPASRNEVLPLIQRLSAVRPDFQIIDSLRE